MSTLPRLLALALLALPLVGTPVDAQQRVQTDRQDKIQPALPDDAAPDRQDPGRIMHRVLPFLDGQTMRYYDPAHNLEAYARRRGLAIRFYDAKDTYLGRAQRVTQEVTRYYDADGNYLGRRVNQKQATTTTVVAHDPAPAPAGVGAGH
jgi:hypothetical protein